MTKYAKITVLITLVGWVFTVGCKEKDILPSNRFEGTWTLESYTYAAEGEAATDIFAFISAISPCVRQNRVTFQNGTYTTSLPTDCVDEDGVSLQLFPESPTGTYVINDSGDLAIVDGNFTYEGRYVFENNNKVNFTIVEDDVKVLVVLVRK